MPPESPPAAVLTVAPEEGGARLDRFLAEHLEASRHQVQSWIRDGRVEVAERPTSKPSRSLNAGEVVRCRVPPKPATDPRVEPEDGPLEVLFEDPHLAVIDKPPGLAVHPGAGRSEGTLVHRMLYRYPEMAGVGGPGRPGIVHRLDLDTSGLLVVARSDLAYRGLADAFARRRVAKRYLAIVYGLPAVHGTIDRPIARHPQRRKEMTVVAGGRRAVTHYRRIDSAEVAATLLDVDLETGRTHQIRVHLKAVGHPLVGDPVYGEKRWKGLQGRSRALLRRFPRPALHAWRLAFHHPVEGRLLRFEAPPAADLIELWRQLGRPWPEPEPLAQWRLDPSDK